MLFVPGGDERKLAKIHNLHVPAFILDLEDAVARSKKHLARAAVSSLVSLNKSREFWVRVNTDDSLLLHDDLDAVVHRGLSGIVLPKVRNLSDVDRVDWLLDVLEVKRGLERDSIGILPTIETVDGLSDVDRICRASSRIRCLGFGAGDFSLDLGLEWPSAEDRTNETIIAAKIELVLASRRAGLLPPHDGSYPTYRDPDGLLREVRESKRLGFAGKHAIHPDQIPIILRAFLPTVQEIERASKVVDAFNRQERHGVGNVAHDGRLIDYPVAHRAQHLLELAGEAEDIEYL
jgi:citrate lyase subunit beta/citryl-CoA lyase